MNAPFNVLVNAIGIRDSGGIVVLENLLQDLSVDKRSIYYIVCSNSINIIQLIDSFDGHTNLSFSLVGDNRFVYRLYYENIIFKRIIKNNNIKLIYNFSGSLQFFIKTPQLVKVHNLAFLSKRVDYMYNKNSKLFLWIKQIALKRLLLKIMLSRAKNIEIQSDHVRRNLADFIKTSNKNFYLKSDICVSSDNFSRPKKYNFSQRIKFIYIVGPHFESIHKNFIDFTRAMLCLNNQNFDFEIIVTLDRNQLAGSDVWNVSLDSRTKFIGYISDKKKMKGIFCDNAILISTSIIETLGLHVIDGIKNGIITITPREDYAEAVYGINMVNYELFNKGSLLRTIMEVVNSKKNNDERALSLQDELKKSESNKYQSILEVFREVKNF